MDSLQEYIGLAEELRTQFASGEDAALVTAAVAAGAELAAAAAAREGRATTEIERLVALLTDRESAAVRPEPENAHTARVADLEGANTAAKENVSSLTASAAALEARRADTATACASLATQAAASDHVKAVLHPRAGFEVSLYIYLTHLHWNDMDGAIAAAVQAAAVPGADPTAPPLAVPDTGRVRAVIADPYVMKKRAAAAKPGFGGGGSDDFSSADAARHEMHPIDLDTRGMSAVQVAHALWGMVEKTM